MRIPGRVVLVVAAALLVGLALAATLQSRHDESVSARGLLAAWRGVGGSLVEPSLIAASTDTGLDCFTYSSAHGLVQTVLCFDAERRLVEALRETTASTSLVSVSTSPGRSPVRLSAAALAAATKAAGAATAVAHLPRRSTAAWAPS